MDLFESMLDRVVVNDPTPAMQHFAATVIGKLASQTCKQGSLLRTNGPPLQFKLIGPQRERESRHDRNDYWRQWLTASRLAMQVETLRSEDIPSVLRFVAKKFGLSVTKSGKRLGMFLSEYLTLWLPILVARPYSQKLCNLLGV